MPRKTVPKRSRRLRGAFTHERDAEPTPKLGAHPAAPEPLLEVNERKPRRERLTLTRLFEERRATTDYVGGYDAVRRHARRWQREEAVRTAAVFVPLIFDPSDAYQFDWSHEQVVRGGVAKKWRWRTCGCAAAG